MGWGKEVVSLIDLLVNLFLVPLGSVAFVCSQSLPFDMGKELWPKFPPSSCTSTSAAQGWGGRGRPSPYICVVIQDSRLPPLPAPLLPLPLLFLLLGSPAQSWLLVPSWGHPSTLTMAWRTKANSTPAPPRLEQELQGNGQEENRTLGLDDE